MQIRSLALIVLLGMLFGATIACGGDDDDAGNAGDETPADSSDATNEPEDSNGNDGEAAGTITIGDESWTIVPTIQCGNFYEAAGQVYVSGVAAEDETIEISLDYDDTRVGASVEKEGATQQRDAEQPAWHATDDTGLVFEVDGDTITGSGTFMHIVSGEEAEGSFEVTC